MLATNWLLLITTALRVCARLVISARRARPNDLELRHSEERLRASEARLRAIVDAEPECVKLVDRDGRLLEMNPAGLRMLDADNLQAVLGARVNELVIAEHRASFDALITAAFRGESSRGEFDMVSLRGVARSMESNVVPLRDEHGAVVAALAITRDVTERRQTEAALRASEARYRSVVDSVREVIFQTDRFANWTLLNPAWTESTGFEVESSLGYPVLDVVHADDRASFMTHFRALLDGTADEWRHELRCVAQDGSVHWMEIMARPILAPDNTIARTSGAAAPAERPRWFRLNFNTLLADHFYH